MQRGQTFETMMLVISVIVAIAILGVLMGFLSGVSFGAKDAKSVMPQLLAKVHQSGYGIEFEKGVEFKQGAIILRGDVVGQAAVSSDNVKFSCSDTSICGSGKPIPATDQQLGPVNTKITAAVAVCTKDGVSFWVSVHTTADGATTDCKSKAKL